MANIYQSGGKVAGKIMSKLTELTADLVKSGKTTDEVRDILSQKVPGATPSQIETAITPTLQSRVEKGKELMVVEPGVAKPTQPELSTETGLVPTGRSRTTFIAGEEGVSAGGPSPMGPIPVRTEGRTVEERIRAKREEPAVPAPEQAPAGGGLTKTQKIGAGLVAGGAVGMATRGGEEKPESAKLPVYNVNPIIRDDGTLEPSGKELEEANSRGGYQAVRELWNTYEDLNKQVKELPLTGSRSDVNVKVQRSQNFLSELRSKAKKPLVLSPAALGLPAEEQPAAEQPAKTTLKQETAVTPSPVRGGGQPVKAPTSESDVEKSASQAVKGFAAQKSATDVQDKINSGQQLTRADIRSLYERIEAIKPQEVAADPELMNQIKSAREEARKAYKEQANINQWAEVAQTVGNAVANYVAAMRGVADRALALPNVDYGARTMAALREYQTELDSLTEQGRAVERGVERGQRASEQAAERQQRSLERLAAYGERQLEAEARRAERAQDRATQLQIANIRDSRTIAAEAAKTQEKADKAAAATGKTQASLLGQTIRETDKLIADLEQKRALAANVANAGDKPGAFDKAFNEYAADKGITKQAPEFQKEGWFGGPKFNKEQAISVATTNLDELTKQIADLRKQKADAQARREAALTGGVQPTAQPAGQQPAAGGKVKLDRVAIQEYATLHKMTPEAAKKFLAGQGYPVED